LFPKGESWLSESLNRYDWSSSSATIMAVKLGTTVYLSYAVNSIKSTSYVVVVVVVVGGGGGNGVVCVCVCVCV
jgi:hypothetical protein